MPRLLLAAEADQIQDLLFRSSRLREITGASHGLETFCDEVASRILTHTRYPSFAGAPVHAGGAFRILFQGRTAEEDVQAFARDLADVYAIRFGGRISVSNPVEAEEDDGRAMERAAEALRRAKAGGDLPAIAAALPYLEPCASCGVEPAATAAEHPEGPGRICRFCAVRERDRRPAVSEFIDRITGLAPDAAGAEGLRPADVARRADEVGAHDRRSRMVAYLLADGNGFGKLFEDVYRAGLEPLARVSGDLRHLGRDSLAAAAAALLQAAPSRFENQLPVVPLITGGDDVFALIPAPWAFWFAQQFACAFEQRAARALDGLRVRQPTVSCALVFCKQSFPYRLAYTAGTGALRTAKRIARAGDNARSCIAAVELRGTVVAGEGGSLEAGARGAQVRSAAYEVFALGGTGVAGGPEGPTVQALLEARNTLVQPPELPATRRADLEAAFDPERYGGTLGDESWRRHVETVVRRVEGEDLQRRLGAVLKKLGGDDYLTPSACEPQRRPRVSAAVDLLEFWRYLEQPREGTP